MTVLFWDASALIKRYFAEIGSDVVNAIFTNVPRPSMASTPWGYAESYSILLRRLNGGVLDLPSFTTAVTSLQAEVVNNPAFGLLSIDDTTVFASISVMQRHNLNATDAALLALLLEVSQLPGAPSYAVVASDKRLLRAADLEGFKTLRTFA